MTDLDRALADIEDIKRHMTSSALFRGFGPQVTAATGLIGLATGAAQAARPDLLAATPATFVLVWTAVAIICAALMAFEAFARTRRHHGGLADAMLFQAIEHFFPAGVAGAALALVFWHVAPDMMWLLPGLWSLLVALALFAAYRFLPRTISVAAAWYFVAGIGVLLWSADARDLSPWAMTIPFGIGQLLLAVLLFQAEAAPQDSRGRKA